MLCLSQDTSQALQNLAFMPSATLLQRLRAQGQALFHVLCGKWLTASSGHLYKPELLRVLIAKALCLCC